MREPALKTEWGERVIQAEGEVGAKALRQGCPIPVSKFTYAKGLDEAPSLQLIAFEGQEE